MLLEVLDVRVGLFELSEKLKGGLVGPAGLLLLLQEVVSRSLELNLEFGSVRLHLFHKLSCNLLLFDGDVLGSDDLGELCHLGLQV